MLNDDIQQAPFKTVFSVLFDQPLEYLDPFVKNFQFYTTHKEALVINIIPGHKDVLERAYAIEDCRVFVIDSKINDKKLEYNPLIRHLESFIFAESHLTQFEYFSTLLFNSLLYKDFNLEQAIKSMGSNKESHKNINAIPDEEWWSTVRSNLAFYDFCKNKNWQTIVKNKLEGLFAERSSWRGLLSLKAEIEKLSALDAPEKVFPIEEVIPGSFFYNECHQHYTNLPTLLG